MLLRQEKELLIELEVGMYNYLINDKNGLKKFNHIFKKIINSELFDSNVKDIISYQKCIKKYDSHLLC